MLLHRGSWLVTLFNLISTSYISSWGRVQIKIIFLSWHIPACGPFPLVLMKLGCIQTTTRVEVNSMKNTRVFPLFWGLSGQSSRIFYCVSFMHMGGMLLELQSCVWNSGKF